MVAIFVCRSWLISLVSIQPIFYSVCLIISMSGTRSHEPVLENIYDLCFHNHRRNDRYLRELPLVPTDLSFLILIKVYFPDTTVPRLHLHLCSHRLRYLIFFQIPRRCWVARSRSEAQMKWRESQTLLCCRDSFLELTEVESQRRETKIGLVINVLEKAKNKAWKCLVLLYIPLSLDAGLFSNSPNWDGITSIHFHMPLIYGIMSF